MISKYNQLGLSMVELLVALAISSFLILGITQIYIDNKKNYFFQQGQMENNDTARFVIYALDNELRKIGYRRRPDSSYEETFKEEDGFSAGEVIKIQSDSELTFRYQPHSAEDYSCDGTAVSDADIDKIYKTVSDDKTVVVTIKFDKDKNVIKCNGTEVVSNVLAFNILYAIPVDDISSREGLKYVKASELDSSKKIKGIRYQALVTSNMKNLTDFEGSKAVDAYYKDDTDKPSDRAIYQTLVKSVMLRNLMTW